ncbi:MAG: hypothetical protein VX038_06765 [Verrucomicrobiota bacterium]|nr:hypothetical protein [Verrucomicrobiota bacterium]
MFSKSKAFYFSTAGVLLLFLIFFWLTTSFGLSTLEKFVFDLTNVNLFGYKIPQLFGSDINASPTAQAKLLKIVFTLLVLLFCILMSLVGLRKSPSDQLKLLSKSIGFFILFCLTILLFGVVLDDHTMLKSEKVELFSVCSVSLIVGITLTVLSKDKPKLQYSSEVVTVNSVRKKTETLKVVEDDKESNSVEPKLNDDDETDDPNSEDASIKIDPLSEELTMEEDLLVADTPSLKTLSPPGPDEIPDEILKLREELVTESESEEEGSSDEENEIENAFGENEEMNEDPLVSEIPSKKGLPPPGDEDLPEELLKLREEVSSDEIDDKQISDEEKPS